MAGWFARKELDIDALSEPDIPCVWGLSEWDDGDIGVEMAAGGGIDNVWPYPS